MASDEVGWPSLLCGNSVEGKGVVLCKRSLAKKSVPFLGRRIEGQHPTPMIE